MLANLCWLLQGICQEHYPNMFMISGPQSPFANLPIVLDNTADWIGKVSHCPEHANESVQSITTSVGHRVYGEERLQLHGTDA
jgi:hypothetical protein